MARLTHEHVKTFDSVLSHARAFFVLGRPDDMEAAGTREMVARYVRKKMGGVDVPDLMISAALKRLKDDNAILFDKRVWWFLGDR